MFLIKCPYCGERDESEFSYGGEAYRQRPSSPESLTDEQWADYLFMRKNSKGPFAEQWVHSAGCRKWFHVIRDTVSYDIIEVYKMGAKPKTKLNNDNDSTLPSIDKQDANDLTQHNGE